MSSLARYSRHRFPIEVVEQCVWLYFRFVLSQRDVEEMMAKRGVRLTYETVREWCGKFGALLPHICERSAKTGLKWHLDEVSSRSMACNIISGELLTSREPPLTSWYSHDGIAGQPCGSFASYWIWQEEHRG